MRRGRFGRLGREVVVTETPPPGESPKARSEKRGRDDASARADLSHFYRKQRQGDKEIQNIGLLDRLSEQWEVWRKRLQERGGQAASAAEAVEALKKVRVSRKTVLIAAGAVVALVLVLVVLPRIPLQIQRSAGFAAFQSGDYPEAYRELGVYLQKRPQDYDAAYAAAQAALYSGDADYARRVVGEIYRVHAAADPRVWYHFALLNFSDTRTALAALNELLQVQPRHAGARLARGILLGRMANSVREARDDFLQLEEILRDGGDVEEMAFLHRYLHENDLLPLTRQPALYDGGLETPLSRVLGFDAGFDGFAVSLRLSDNSALLAEELSVAEIANLHFAYMLIEQNEIDEAQSVMTGLLRGNPDSAAVRQMDGLVKIYRREYRAAAEAFAELLTRFPGDARTMNNLATIEALRGGEEVNVARLAGFFDGLGRDEGGDALTAGNAAYAALLDGDADAAESFLANIEGDGAPRVALARAVALWVRGDIVEARRRLGGIDAVTFPAVNRFLVAIDEERGDYEAALKTLDTMMTQSVNDSEFLLWRVRILNALGEWRLAMKTLDQLAALAPGNYEAEYYRGVLALRLGDDAAFDVAQSELEAVRVNPELSHYRFALSAARHLHEGNLEAAAAGYYLALQNAEEPARHLRYLVDWAAVYVGIDAEEVAQVLEAHLRDGGRPEVDALFAFALSESDPARAAEHAGRVRGVGAYVANFYAGAALARIGDHERAIPLLLAARESELMRVDPLVFLRLAYEAARDAEKVAQVDKTLEYVRAVAAGQNPAPEPTYRVFFPKIAAVTESARQALAGETGAYEEAGAAYEKALNSEEDPVQRAEILFSQATFEAFNNFYDKSTALFERLLGLGLGNQARQVEAMLFYAEILSRQGRYGDAARVIRQVRQLEGESLQYDKLLAEALANDGRQQEAAVAILTAVLETYPGETDLYYQLASLYVTMQLYPEAVEVLRRLLRVSPNYAPAYRLFAEVNAVLGERQRAQAYSEVYVSLTANE